MLPKPPLLLVGKKAAVPSVTHSGVVEPAPLLLWGIKPIPPRTLNGEEKEEEPAAFSGAAEEEGTAAVSEGSVNIARILG